MKEINNCCLISGSEDPSVWCARKCRLYQEAKHRADINYHRPYIGTGFGNLNGIPTLREIRIEAGKILASQTDNLNAQESPDTSLPEPIGKLRRQGFKFGKIDSTKSKPEDRNLI